MLSWSLAFFVLAVAAAVLGFGGIAVAFTGIAKFLFLLFLLLFIGSFFFKVAEKADEMVEKNLS